MIENSTYNLAVKLIQRFDQIEGNEHGYTFMYLKKFADESKGGVVASVMLEY